MLTMKNYDAVGNFLESLKHETLGLNTIESNGPYTTEELTQGSSRTEYIEHVMTKGNTQRLSGLFYDELNTLDEVLVLTLSNQSIMRILHDHFYHGDSRLIRSVNIFAGSDSFDEIYKIKNKFERYDWLTLGQVQNILPQFSLTITAAIRQTKDENQDTVYIVTRKV